MSSETTPTVAEVARGTRRRADAEALGNTRTYLPPPKPRTGSRQALLWSAGYMVPFSPPLPSGRNVECCIVIKGENGEVRKCGDTLKHIQGGPTTNLLKHMKAKHPEEARLCLESSKHSHAYRDKLGSLRNFARPDGNSGMTVTAALPQSNTEDPVAIKANSEAACDQASWERSCALMCALDLRSPKTLWEPGFQFLASRVVTKLGGHPTPRFCDAGFRKCLERECMGIDQTLAKLLATQREFVPFGPCCSLQLDTWELPSSSNALHQNEQQLVTVLTASLVSPTFRYQVVGLGVQAFSATSTAEEVAAWVRERVTKFWGDGTRPADIALAITVGHGAMLPAAVNLLGVPCLRCLHLFLQKATHAGLKDSGAGKLAQFFVRALALSEKLTSARKRIMTSHPRVSIKAELQNVNKTVDKLSRLLSLPSKFSVDAEALGILLEDEEVGLTEADWRRLQDLLGVLEAVCEVDSTILEGSGPTFAAVATQMTELQEYLSEDIVYVPVAHEQEGEELNRLERPVTEVDSLVLELRTAVVRHLRDDLPRDTTTQRLKALSLILSPSQHADAQQELAGESELEALHLLEDEFHKAANKLSQQHSKGCIASEVNTHEETGEKRPWRGVLHAFKQQKTEHTGPKELSQEVQMYVSMTEGEQLETELDILSWWARHTRQRQLTGKGVSSDGCQFPVLSRLAAQYHSLSPCAFQASLLLGDMQHRLAELLETLPWPTVQYMLYLRLNRTLLPAAEQ